MSRMQRREVLKKGAMASGAIMIGGGTMTGGAVAHTKGKGNAVAYRTGRPAPVSEGEQWTLGSPQGTEKIRNCNNPRGPAHKVRKWGTDPGFPDSPNFHVQSNSLALHSGDEIEVAKVIGECRESGLVKVQITKV